MRFKLPGGDRFKGAECCALARTNYRSTTLRPLGESPAAEARSVRRQHVTPPQVGIRPKLPVPLAVGVCAPAGAIFALGLIAPGVWGGTGPAERGEASIPCLL
jgi:hypothetical protein